jgi:hypothetical protein
MPIIIKRPRSQVELCVDLSLQSAWENAAEALKKAQSQPNQMLNNAVLTEAAKAVTDLEDEMAASTLVFELQAVTRKAWQEYEAAHPPREGHKDDETFSVNCSTFFDAVAPVMITGVREKVSGEVFAFDPATEWSDLANEMTEAQYNVFALKILNMNRGTTDVPFSPAASRVTAASDESSSSPNGSESVTSV